MKSCEKCEYPESSRNHAPMFVLRLRGLSSGSGAVGEIKKAPVWILIISGICDNTTIKWACEDLWKWPFWNSRDNEFWYISWRAPSSSSLHVHLNAKLISTLEDSWRDMMAAHLQTCHSGFPPVLLIPAKTFRTYVDDQVCFHISYILSQWGSVLIYAFILKLSP